MKATELKPGQHFVCEDHTTGVVDEEGKIATIYTPKGNCNCYRLLSDIAIEVTPLGPVTPIESLPRIDGITGDPICTDDGGWHWETKPAILESDLQGLSLTTGDAERVAELEGYQLDASRKELEIQNLLAERDKLIERVKEVVGESNQLFSMNAALRSELAQLRAGQVLGEACREIRGGRWYAVIINGGLDTIFRSSKDYFVTDLKDRTYHEYTGPLPSLPAPAEEVPSVTGLWELQFDQNGGRQSVIFKNGVIADLWRHAAITNGCKRVELRPITPSPELIAALAGSEGKE